MSEAETGGQTARGPLIAGLDIGGTKTHAVVAESADDTGRVIGEVRLATAIGSEGLLATLTQALTRVAATAEVDAATLAAVGIGVPGLVDPTTGALRHAINLGIGNGPFDLAGAAARLVGGPVVVDNDTNLAALGAADVFGVHDLAYLSLGTGVSVGLVFGGTPHRGAHGMAGEIGHLPIDPQGVLCECGQRGCLETVVSGTAIARRWPADGPLGSTAALLAAAASGDSKAIAVRDQLSGAIAAAVALAAQAVDPELVVLGGGVADAGPPLLSAVRAALRARAELSPLLGAFDLADRVAIVPAGGVPVGALGALRAAREAIRS